MRPRIRVPHLKISVSQKDIENAVPKASSHCMIADAIKAQYPQFAAVSVDVQSIRLSDRKKGLRYTFLTPSSAQVPIVQFDQGKKPEPFEFTLRNGHGVHIASTRVGPKGKERMAVKLGRKRIESQERQKPNVIGGRAPKKLTGFGMRREFGGLRLSLGDLLGSDKAAVAEAAVPQAAVNE